MAFRTYTEDWLIKFFFPRTSEQVTLKLSLVGASWAVLLEGNAPFSAHRAFPARFDDETSEGELKCWDIRLVL